MRPKITAPVPAISAAVAQAIAGTGDPGSGMPVVSAASSSSAAMPRAVPSCAAVLMMPDAVPRAATGTLVPSLVEATEDTPMPAPAAATHNGSTHRRLAAGMSAASATAMIAKPAETRRCGPHRASAGAASADPAMTATLNGTSISPATSGLCPRVSCRYSVTRVMAELVVNVFSRPPAAPSRSGRTPSTARGSRGAAERLSTAMNTPARTTATASSAPPSAARPGSGSSVVATTNAITAAVNAHTLSPLSRTDRSTD